MILHAKKKQNSMKREIITHVVFDQQGEKIKTKTWNN